MNPDIVVMGYDDVITKGVLDNTRVSPSFNSTSDDMSVKFSTSMKDFGEIPFMKQPKSVRKSKSSVQTATFSALKKQYHRHITPFNYTSNACQPDIIKHKSLVTSLAHFNPVSHRKVENRRRDRMNNCLADLSNLIPANCIKQGQGRVGKEEIINMAIQHIKNLTKEISRHGALQSSMPDRYLGYKECQDEVMRSLVEVEGWDKMSQLCARLMAHLEQQGKKFRIMNDESINQIAKEEQYRNADEEQSVSSIKVKTPVFPDFKDFYRDTTFTTMKMPHIARSHSSLLNNISMETPDLIQGALESFANAQEMTREHLKRDNRQWTLLTTKYDSPMVEDSGLSTGSNSDSHTNKSSVYKFKHNISKRFYRDEKESSDRSSRSSREEKRMFGHLCSHRTSSSASSRYPTSESFYIKTSSYNSENDNGIEKTNASDLLAVFVLHPSGTHYLPLSIHRSDMPNDFFSEAHQDPHLYHPINIRVDFSGKTCQPFRRQGSVSANSSGESSCPSEAANLCNKQRTHSISKAHRKS